jgi:predicted ATPase/class 3 adenylate cyclase
VTVFLFTDIEGSTRLWERHGRSMTTLLERHDRLLSEVIAAHGGRVLKHLGDGVFAVFEDGDGALACLLELQRRLGSEDWSPLEELRVRTALHAGQAERLGEDFFGPVINRTARIMDAGWGGQILLSPEAAEECAVPPGGELVDLGTHQLRDLARPQRILTLDHPELPLRRFPELRTLGNRPNNLPPQATPFVGRVEERRELHKLLDRAEMGPVTVTGPGGMGKTRLALQVAAERVDRYDDGVYFVALAPLEDPEQLVGAMAEALSFSFYPGGEPREQLLTYLQNKQLLLVLDNFEHLTAAATLLAEIAERCPRVRYLVTSRERLNLRGEQLYAIDGLQFPRHWEPAPQDHYSALHLFLESARRMRPDFVITPGNVRPVIRICELVGGMPLGLELAASWVRTLEPEEIAGEIAEGMDFLESDLRDLPARHRSLHGVVDYSWRLLDDGEKRLFRSLAVFQGGFDKTAARKVLGVGARPLLSLVDKSLLSRDSDGRYQLHEVVRAYAEERLAEEPELRAELREVHARYYIETYGGRIREAGFGDPEKRRVIHREDGNLTAAYRWCVESGERELLEGYLSGFSTLYQSQNRYTELIELLDWAIGELGGGSDSLEGRLRRFRGTARYRSGAIPESIEDMERALAIFDELGDERELYATCYQLGAAHFRTYNFDQARELFECALERSRRLERRDLEANALAALGDLENGRGNYDEGFELCSRALDVLREVGDTISQIHVLITIGDIHYHRRDYTLSEENHREAAELSDEQDYRWGSALARSGLCAALRDDHRPEEALAVGRRSLELFTQIGARSWQANCLHETGEALTNLGRYDEAAKSLDEAAGLYDELKLGAYGILVEVSRSRLLFHQGRFGEAAGLIESLEHRMNEEGLSFDARRVRMLRCWCELELGRTPRETLDELADGEDLMALGARVALARLAREAGDLDERRERVAAAFDLFSGKAADDEILLLALELFHEPLLVERDTAVALAARIARHPQTPRHFAHRAAETARKSGLAIDTVDLDGDGFTPALLGLLERGRGELSSGG